MNYMQMLDELARMQHHGCEEVAKQVVEAMQKEEIKCEECGTPLLDSEIELSDGDNLCIDCMKSIGQRMLEESQHPDMGKGR